MCIRDSRPGQVLVGFAAEHGDGALVYGVKKLREKSLDAVVVNDISRSDIGFEADANEVVIVTTQAQREVSRRGKDEVADAVLDEVERLIAEREETGGGARARTGSAVGL